MKKSNDLTRREFVVKTVAATSAVALANVLPPAAWAAATCDTPTETLLEIGQIAGKDGPMKGVLSIKNHAKILPGYKGKNPPMMRYFAGKDLTSGATWPPADKITQVLPGPTLRVAVGQNVQLTFLNQVDVGAFPGGTLDNAETGATTGCDEATNAALVDDQGKKLPPDKEWYPETRGDSFPNCFHGSSTANVHFHGTHVTPDGFGDNVLVQIRPDPNIKEEDVQPMFDKIFAQCGEHAPAWKDPLLDEYRAMQEKAVKNYDLHAIWKGTRGPVKDSNGNDVPALPLENQLAPKNEANVAKGEWPQYFIGAFPNCFPVTKAVGHKMGQAPGTHWYHSHKHGSTAINLFNGLAGALIIEGDYDKELRAAIPGLKEKVLVVQVFTALPNLELGAMFGQGATQGTRAIVTNGSPVTKANAGNGTAQVAPTILMQPGEIQLWRIINAQVQTTLANAAFTGLAGDKTASPMPVFRQTAQDGVQFKFFNYDKQPLTAPVNKNGTAFSVAPGGRVDILVQAPMLPEGKNILCFELGGIVNLKVAGTPITNQKFPDESNYPTFPKWLDDLPKNISEKKDLSFDWEQYRIRRGPANNDTTNAGKNKTHSKAIPLDAIAGSDGVIKVEQNRGPYYMVSGKQFDEGDYDQTMQLDIPEEWTIYNTTGVAHPFHIHINPFQVVKVYDPNSAAGSYTADDNGVWQDVIMVPAAKKDSTGAIIVGDDGFVAKENRGYVVIRSPFVDFTGSYVLHCHILAHEDRGMMQLVRVISGATTIQHH